MVASQMVGQHRLALPPIAKPDFDAVSLKIKLEANLNSFEKFQ
jgi:hypothetical protein